ncbi:MULTISPECIES: Uma2 family endonuclease [unclassified Crossiella]|uniref:Uma2 family endonuclease n=1 Tax=unclassified Crossiella TaxID=2620835 RepID=UPI001FFE9208|nr:MULTISPECIES: Uma2 family endonuclease [unclassified Crossiella]MCK2240714.1 Uma2 family endonuclease [Crossiella sp. S99.2]MCK2252835.1 Uma2 family endonuclease [Crossiella sp. S99.1]
MDLDDLNTLPDWMRPPRAEGWYADDLDHLPDAPEHIELIDGALVFRLVPQTVWHSAVVSGLTLALATQAPPSIAALSGMTIRLDRHNRPEADILVHATPPEPDRTWFRPADVLLVVEVVLPESAHRDRTVKLRKYAAAGIPHYWIVDREDAAPVVHAYELDRPTGAYVPAGIFRGTLERPVPFLIAVDLNELLA